MTDETRELMVSVQRVGVRHTLVGIGAEQGGAACVRAAMVLRRAAVDPEVMAAYPVGCRRVRESMTRV